MASQCARGVFHTCRRSLSFTAVSHVRRLPSTMDIATGAERDELIALATGNDDPFLMKALKRGPGTKECPNLVPSAFKSRIVGCVCEDDQTHVNWMWLHDGAPRRCECGFWFKLTEKKLKL